MKRAELGRPVGVWTDPIWCVGRATRGRHDSAKSSPDVSHALPSQWKQSPARLCVCVCQCLASSAHTFANFKSMCTSESV